MAGAGKAASSGPAAAAPAAAWYALGVLILACILAFVDKQILAIVAAPMARTLGLSNAQLGLVQGFGVALFGSLAMLPIGWLADRFDRRRVLAAGILLWSISTCLCGVSQSYRQLLVATIGVAIGEAVLRPIVWALIPDVFPRRLWVTANILYFVAALLGISIGLASGSAVLELFSTHRQALPAFLAEPWRASVAAVALPGLILAILVLLIPSRARSSRAPAGSPDDRIGLWAYGREVGRVLLPLFASEIALQAPLTALAGWLPVGLPRRFAVTPSSVGYQLSLAIGTGSVVGVGAAYLLSRRLAVADDLLLGPMRIAKWAFVAAACCALPLLALGAPVQAAWLSALIFGVSMGAASLLPAIMQVLTPQHLRARVAALASLFAAIGAGLGPIVVGYLSGRGGGDTLDAIAGVNIVCWLAAALLLLLAERSARTIIARRMSRA